jgi:uncharacterized protein
MTTLLSKPVAATVVAIDESGGANLTDLARATQRSISTIQRAVDRLVDAGAVIHESPRGRLTFRDDVPRRALRELAEWQLGDAGVRDIVRRVHVDLPAMWPRIPPTISNPRVRDAWPQTIKRIARAYHPRRVILFGSQARGNADPESDVDLLVVFDDGHDERERRVGIRRLLADAPFAKDILVASEDELERPLPGTAFASAVKEGIVVYER